MTAINLISILSLCSLLVVLLPGCGKDLPSAPARVCIEIDSFRTYSLLEGYKMLNGEQAAYLNSLDYVVSPLDSCKLWFAHSILLPFELDLKSGRIAPLSEILGNKYFEKNSQFKAIIKDPYDQRLIWFAPNKGMVARYNIETKDIKEYGQSRDNTPILCSENDVFVGGDKFLRISRSAPDSVAYINYPLVNFGRLNLSLTKDKKVIMNHSFMYDPNSNCFNTLDDTCQYLELHPQAIRAGKYTLVPIGQNCDFRVKDNWEHCWSSHYSLGVNYFSSYHSASASDHEEQIWLEQGSYISLVDVPKAHTVYGTNFPTTIDGLILRYKDFRQYKKSFWHFGNLYFKEFDFKSKEFKLYKSLVPDAEVVQHDDSYFYIQKDTWLTIVNTKWYKKKCYIPLPDFDQYKAVDVLFDSVRLSQKCCVALKKLDSLHARTTDTLLRNYIARAFSFGLNSDCITNDQSCSNLSTKGIFYAHIQSRTLRLAIENLQWDSVRVIIQDAKHVLPPALQQIVLTDEHLRVDSLLQRVDAVDELPITPEAICLRQAMILDSLHILTNYFADKGHFWKYPSEPLLKKLIKLYPNSEQADTADFQLTMQVANLAFDEGYEGSDTGMAMWSAFLNRRPGSKLKAEAILALGAHGGHDEASIKKSLAALDMFDDLHVSDSQLVQRAHDLKNALNRNLNRIGVTHELRAVKVPFSTSEQVILEYTITNTASSAKTVRLPHIGNQFVPTVSELSSVFDAGKCINPPEFVKAQGNFNVIEKEITIGPNTTRTFRLNLNQDVSVRYLMHVGKFIVNAPSAYKIEIPIPEDEYLRRLTCNFTVK